MTKHDIRVVLEEHLKEGGLETGPLASLLDVDGRSLRKLLKPFIKDNFIYKNGSTYYLVEQKHHEDMFARALLYIIHYGGAILIAAANLLFFTSNVYDPVYKVVVGSIAIIFALGEVVLWDKGVTEHSTLFKSCGVLIAVFSFIATTGIGMDTVQTYREEKVNEWSEQSIRNEIVFYQKAMGVLDGSLAALPPEYITRRNAILADMENYNNHINILTKELESKKDDATKAEKGLTIFALISEWTGWSIFSIVLWYTMLRSLGLEIVVLATTVPRRTR